jgi:hypothetical protein
MTDDLVMPAPEVVRRLECGGWTINPAGRPEVLALDSGHFFADGDGVSVLLRMSGEDALVSDGGAMKHRLSDAQVDLTGERARGAWASTLRDFGLEEIDDRVVGRKHASALVPLLADLVDAMLTLDGLKVLARRPQLSRLERQLYSFLSDSVRLPFKQHPTVRMPQGTEIRPTAKVEAPGRDIYVQTASQEGVGRATYVTKALKLADIGLTQRMIVLKGRRADWAQDYVDILGDDATVGFMDDTVGLRKLFTTA